MRKIIIADDEYIIAMMLAEYVRELGFEVVALAHSGEEAVELAFKLRPDLVLLDIKMESDTAGIEAGKKIQTELPEVDIYFISAYDKSAHKKELENLCCKGYVDKTNYTVELEKVLK